MAATSTDRPSPTELPTLQVVVPIAGVDTTKGTRADAVRNHDKILCAVRRLVNEHGPDGVTMDGVAAAAGVGKGTVFRRFGDRQGLLFSLLDERTRAFQDNLISGPPPVGPGAPARERLLAFGEHMLDFVGCEGLLMRSAERSASEAGARLRHPVNAFYFAHLLMLVREADPSLDPEWTAGVLLAALNPELCLHQTEQLGMDPKRQVEGWRSLVQRLVPD